MALQPRFLFSGIKQIPSLKIGSSVSVKCKDTQKTWPAKCDITLDIKMLTESVK